MLIVFNLGLIGALAQIGGFILIFRTFLPDLYDYICKVPVVGHYLSNLIMIKKAIGFKISWIGSPEINIIEYDCLLEILYQIIH